MIRYRSLSGKKSGVMGYEFGDDFISVFFFNGEHYTYSESSNGKATIDHMKSLALASRGLSTFIAQHRDTLRFN